MVLDLLTAKLMLSTGRDTLIYNVNCPTTFDLHCIIYRNSLICFLLFYLQIEPFPDPLNPNKIVRPNSMWTAGCCVWKEMGKAKAQSIAVMGNNDSDKGKLGTTSMTLAELEGILVDKMSPPADLFPGSLKECRQNSFLLN